MSGSTAAWLLFGLAVGLALGHALVAALFVALVAGLLYMSTYRTAAQRESRARNPYQAHRPWLGRR